MDNQETRQTHGERIPTLNRNANFWLLSGCCLQGLLAKEFAYNGSAQGKKTQYHTTTLHCGGETAHVAFCQTNAVCDTGPWLSERQKKTTPEKINRKSYI
jgi:hypothetical protein